LRADGHEHRGLDLAVQRLKSRCACFGMGGLTVYGEIKARHEENVQR